MADLPKSIRIGYRDYAVEVLSPREGEARNEFGNHSVIASSIQVRTDTKPFETADSLIHEILHGAWQVAGLPRKDEEHCVTLLAHQLTQVWRDNPQFVAFINSLVQP